MTYTFQQYEKFFENFEFCAAGIIYKPRTFNSQRLSELFSIILRNIENEETMKSEILNNAKLGRPVIEAMFEDISWLNSLFEKSKYFPDFLDAIKRWRESL